MAPLTLIFHGELNGLLPASYQNCPGILADTRRRASIKDIVESFGVPHTEVGTILHQGQELPFAYIPEASEIIHIQPHQPPVDISSQTLLQPTVLEAHKFVVDVNVGKLARLLRMLGFDTAYQSKWSDSWIAELAWQEGRIVLSRDKGLLKRKKIEYGRLLRSQQPKTQLQEVLSLFALQQEVRLFSRCLRCNCLLQAVRKERIAHLLLPKTKKYFHEFCICPGCERIYWPGSHMQKMQHLVQTMKPDLR